MANEFICRSDYPVVETKAGKVRGFVTDGTFTFWGIKYADAKRWEMPTEVEPWDGVKDALAYGAVCPMISPETTAGEIMCPHRYWVKDEDCQYLNVWTQSINDENAKKPVLVWFHGGGFSAGSSIEQVAYDGENMSRFGDVVFVSINHRLNILGYLDLSHFSDKFWNSGNVGNADIVASLKWVHDNIARFGGDPGNVTVLGQSGGGRKVQCMMQIPEADGLFHKGFIMSGISDFRGMFTDHPDDAEKEAEEFGKALYQELGIDPAKDAEAIASVPFDTLAAAYNKIRPEFLSQHKYTGCAPMKNSWYAGDPVWYGFREEASSIPVVAGTCLGEFAFMDVITEKNNYSREEQEKIVKSVYGEEEGAEMIRLFSEAYPEKTITDCMLLDNNYRCDTKTFVKKKAAQKAPVFNYVFTYEFPYNGGKIPWHCSDIAFWFHNEDKVLIGNRPGVSDKLEDKMASAVIAFAKTGSPQTPELPEWTPCTPDTVNAMIMNDVCEVRPNHDDKLYEYFNQHKPDLRKFNKNNIALH